MNDIAIRAENLSKQYHIGAKQVQDRNLRETLTDAVVAPFRRAVKLLRGEATGAAELDETIWALKDVSFEIKRGEVIGIVGPNGAGKSTLLKVLSRITEPTEGYAEIWGRVGSLLEVGTGFHHELTGRENIFLNGAILGMRQTEIRRKLDEIIAFSEVEKFIDTPVKHYSSGMYLRLAFAVAAHLEPDIMLVDEVLAVGDAAYQKKCLGKMGDVAREGRTVLLVSHNMGSIASLCEIAMWINAGGVRLIGSAQRVVTEYLRSVSSTNMLWERPKDMPITSKVSLLSARVLSRSGSYEKVLPYDQPFYIEILYQVVYPTLGCTIGLCINNAEGLTILESAERDTTDLETKYREAGVYRAVCLVPGGLLRHGLYYLAIGAWQEGVEMFEPYREVLSFEISPVNDPASDGRLGVIAPVLNWEVEYAEDKVP
jgi:lipopolysaccharide transport system ATP-binding protein